MAVIIGKKMLNDTGQYEDYAIGITLPIQIGNNAFNQAFTTIEQAKSNIKNLLLTNRGERVMQPEFGSGLKELLFNFNDNKLETDIEDTIVNSLEYWLPYVIVDDIVIEQSDDNKDSNIVYVSVSFKISGMPQLETVTFKVKA
jgi:phage baseplate assembly protein W